MPDQRLDARVAQPGDTDLDFMVTGLRLASMTALDGDYDAEAILTFDTSEAAGWWTDSQTGEQHFPDQINHVEITCGFAMLDGYGQLAEEMIRRLGAWGKDRALIAVTSAPHKWTLLRCPQHPAGEVVVLPRRMPQEDPS